MTPTLRSTAPRHRLTWPVLGTLLLVASGAAGACERMDAGQQALEKANRMLEAQAVAGANPIAADETRKTDFNNIISSLNALASDSDPGKSGPAAVLISRAKAGLGEIAARKAADIEQRFVAETAVSRALLDQWNSQHATAASLAKYDPSKDLDAIDKSIAAQNAEAAKREADKAAQERVVTEIEARSDSARSAAKRERDREAGIRKSAEGQSQTAREEIIRKAVEAARAADALDKQASELAAEANKEKPKVAEIVNEIERLHAHADSLKKAKENIQQRAETAKTQSAEARRDADAVGKPLADSLATLSSLREAASGPAIDAQKKFDEAAKGVQKASATAMKEAKTAAFAAGGSARQALGDLLATKIRSLSTYAATLDAISKSVPPLPGASDAGKRAADAREELETARKEAEAAYEEARNSYGKAGGSKEIKDKLEAVSKALEALNAKPAPAPAPETKPEAAKPEDMPGDAKPADAKPIAAALTPEQAKTVETEVRAALKDIAAATAAQDTDKVVAHIATNSEEEKQFLVSSMPVGHAVKALDTACTGKWGKDLSGLLKDCKVPAVKANPMFMMMGAVTAQLKGSDTAMMDSDMADKATIKAISLTEADVTAPDAPSATRMKKDGDTWKITGLGNAIAAAGPMAAQALPMLKVIGEAFTKVGANIKADKYAAADDMLTDLSAQLMGAMGGGGGKPKPPGGGAPKPPSGGGG